MAINLVSRIGKRKRSTTSPAPITKDRYVHSTHQSFKPSSLYPVFTAVEHPTTTTVAIVQPVLPTFQYYLPYISTSITDFYTAHDWAAFDMREANEQAKIEELLASNYKLPFIRPGDFSYYPKQSKLPYNEYMASTQESLVLGREPKRTRLVKKKECEGFWLERAVLKLLKRFKLKS